MLVVSILLPIIEALLKWVKIHWMIMNTNKERFIRRSSSVHAVRIWREGLWGLVSIAGFSRSATWLRNGLRPGISTISWEAVFSYIILKHYGIFKGQQRKPAAFVLHTERLTIKHIHLAKNRFHPHTALWEITIFGNNHAQYPHKISNPHKETVTLLCPGLVYSMTPLSLSRVRTVTLQWLWQ